MDFPELFNLATGQDPYPWQERVAAEGLPEVIDIETGAGKTAGVVLGWLHRLLHHPSAEVRAATPPWLVFALPMRSLVDQTERAVHQWIGRLEADEVNVHRLLGGEGRIDGSWRERPGQPTVLVGTVDMLLSRALMRGYGSSRWMWPVDFGLLHAGCHFVFDEVQLLGPALATSRQLEGLRRAFGVAAPCSSTWMSATLDPGRLRTVDNPQVPAALTLTADDRSKGLERRLSATRLVEERQGAEPKAVAAVAVAEHRARAGTLTLVVVNTVRRAREVYAQVTKLAAGLDGVETGLLHSRFRPADRSAIVDRVINTAVDPSGGGRILVATQVVEAGIDISAATLVTDAAPWSSIVQRAGRCNRAGEFSDARLVWIEPGRPSPYAEDDVAATVVALRALEGVAVTSTDLRELGREVAEVEAVVPVLRRRDLVDLFDTAPDLIGNDIDIARFIRADGDTDVQVAWREAGGGEDAPFSGGPIRPEELCRLSISDARTWLKTRTVVAWAPDHLSPKRPWRRVEVSELRPGAIVVVDASAGGYHPETGWDGVTKKAVPVIPPKASTAVELAPVDEGVADDPASFIGVWVGLGDHLADAERAARALLGEARMGLLSPAQLDAVTRAAAWHDVGKAHEVFQETLVGSAGPEGRDEAAALVPLAKSGGVSRTRHSRPHFRHELVSALLLSEREEQLFEGADVDRDLVRYLVAAHHGRVRLAIRPIPGEVPPTELKDSRVALGVVDGDVVPAVTIGDVHLEATRLNLEAVALGGPRSWTAMALALRDRDDLGPFRLATLEALVRVADWRASAAPSVVHHLGVEEVIR